MSSKALVSSRFIRRVELDRIKLEDGLRIHEDTKNALDIYARDIHSEEVQKKAQAALNYCAGATTYTAANDGKPWKYLLIPHDAVMLNMSLSGLAAKHTQNG